MSIGTYIAPPPGYFVLARELSGTWRFVDHHERLGDAFADAERRAALEPGRVVIVTHANGAFLQPARAAA